MKILVLHTLPPTEPGSGRSPDEFELSPAASNVASALENAVVAGVRGKPFEIASLVEAERPEVVFNLCEAPLGNPGLEAHAVALFEWMGVRFTGLCSQTLALCRHKHRMNAVLAAHGVAVPRTGVFPAIVKPAQEDGSAGIDRDSICEDDAAVQRARARWPGPAMVQEFVDGREFAVSLWGRDTPDHVSIGETLFRNELRLITYAAKWQPESVDFVDSPLDYRIEMDSALRERVVTAARGAWLASGARGYLRVDIRCNVQGVPLVLDVNPNAELGPGVGICRAVQEAGWTWECLYAVRWSGPVTVRRPAASDRHLSQRIRSSTFPVRFSLVSTCGSVNERRGFLARSGSGGAQMANRVWLVTGASRGIGADIAKAFFIPAKPDRNSTNTGIIGVSRDSVRVLPRRLDVTDPEQAARAVAAGLDRFGHIDIVVNNAGICLLGAVEEASARAR